MKRSIVRLACSALVAGIALWALIALLRAPALAEVPFEPATAPHTPNQAVTITLWHPFLDPTDEEALTRLIAEFNTTYTTITVQLEDAGGYQGIYQSVIGAFKDGDPLPNVVIGYPNQFADFARFDILRFLDDIVADVDTTDFYTAALEANRLLDYGPQLAGLPLGQSIEVMYYNNDLLTDAGLAVPTTWAEFQNACANLTTTDSVSGTIMRVDTSHFSTVLWSRGGELVTADNKHARFNEAPGIAALQLYRDLLDARHAIVPPLRPFGAEVDIFADAQAGLSFGSSDTIIRYQDAISDSGAVTDWGLARVPSDPGLEVTDRYGPNIAMLRGTPEQEQASWFLMYWLTDRDQTARWAAETKYFPVRISASTHPSMVTRLASDPQYAQAHTLLPLGQAEPGLRGWLQARDEIKLAMTAVFSDNQPVTDTLNAAAANVEAILAQKSPGAAVIPPDGGTLVYTNTQNLSATVEFPNGALGTTQTVAYVPLDDFPLVLTDGLAFALVPELNFAKPVTITLYYRPSDVEGMDENVLKLYNYDWPSGSLIEVDPCGGYFTDTVNNVFQAAVCHFSDYALLELHITYLPITFKDSSL